MKKIIIAHGHTSIEVMHSMTPFILSIKERDDWKWEFVDYILSNIQRKQGDLLILVRKYHDGKTSDSNIISDLLELRKNFSKIIYFDDSAAASIAFFCAFPYVDEYWKRSTLSDKSLYKKKFYGGHLFSDYYHSKHNIDDESQTFFNPVSNNEIDLKKLKIAWNIGIGVFPLNGDSILDKQYLMTRRFIAAMTILPNIQPVYMLISRYFERMKKELEKEVSFDKKMRKLSSRFMSANYRKSIGFQRKLLIKKTAEKKFFLVGNIKKKEFIQETFKAFGILSPFGWGEICYRDFEAALGGSYLIKPDMSHINTWPNIYSEDMYYSLKWDLSNLDNLDLLFDQSDECEKAVNRARGEYLSSLKTSVARCINMIDQII